MLEELKEILNTEPILYVFPCTIYLQKIWWNGLCFPDLELVKKLFFLKQMRLCSHSDFFLHNSNQIKTKLQLAFLIKGTLRPKGILLLTLRETLECSFELVHLVFIARI